MNTLRQADRTDYARKRDTLRHVHKYMINNYNDQKIHAETHTTKRTSNHNETITTEQTNACNALSYRKSVKKLINTEILQNTCNHRALQNAMEKENTNTRQSDHNTYYEDWQQR